VDIRAFDKCPKDSREEEGGAVLEYCTNFNDDYESLKPVRDSAIKNVMRLYRLISFRLKEVYPISRSIHLIICL
jgi:hypothetical protein